MFSLPQGAIADLSDRAIFKLTGPDTERYLSGQITQDLKLATESQAVYTCVTNAKGKLQGESYIRRHNGAVLVDCPAELREDLFNRLDMYLIADDVELTDITEEISFYHILGEQADAQNTWKCNRYGVDGYDVIEVPVGEVTSPSNWEKLRISNGIPTWGAELTEAILPPEVKLEARAISYNKGCYTGQEVISRMRAAGKVTKSLTQFKLSQSVDLPFAIPHPEKPDAKPVGTITSLADIDGQFIGLGFLATKMKDHSEFSCNGVNITVL